MKKSFFLAVAAVAVVALVGTTACNKTAGKAATSDYSVKVTADSSAYGKVAYLVSYDTGDKLDSVIIEGEEVTIVGTIDEPVLARVLFGNKRRATLVVEPGEIVIDEEGTAIGTRLNNSLMVFDAMSEVITETYNSAESDSVREECDKAFVALVDTIVANNDPVGYYALLQRAYSMELPELEQYLEAHPYYKSYQRVNTLVEGKRIALATAPGNHYTDFEVNGVKFSDMITPGHYTLVDFWASWCGPCRREMAGLKKINADYAAKGLDIIGVAVWDEKADSESAIEELQLPWLQMLDAQRIPTDAYGIMSIPHIMLIDSEGVIVSRGLQGEQLRAVVDSVMTAAPATKPV